MNIKAATAHYTVVQEVDELLAKGAIEESTGSDGLYSNVFVVSRCIGGLRPLLSLK